MNAKINKLNKIKMLNQFDVFSFLSEFALSSTFSNPCSPKNEFENMFQKARSISEIKTSFK
jgi:hypothetical protein